MDTGDWLAIAVIATPLTVALLYGLLRVMGRIEKAPGLKPGRRGGAGRMGMSGVPLSDAPYLDHSETDEERNEPR